MIRKIYSAGFLRKRTDVFRCSLISAVATAFLLLLTTSLPLLAQGGPLGRLYLTGIQPTTTGNEGHINVVQGSTVLPSIVQCNPLNLSPGWPLPCPHELESAIAVDSTIRTLTQPSGKFGTEYTLTGTPTGTSYQNTIPITDPSGGVQLYDGTTDGQQYNYTIDLLTEIVYRTDLNWQNAVVLFTLPRTLPNSSQRYAWLGITYDASDQTLWVSSHFVSEIRHYNLAGTLLGSFNPAATSFRVGMMTALALDPSDGTLWGSTYNAAYLPDAYILVQFSKAGVYLSDISYPGLQSFDVVGGEFEIVPGVFTANDGSLTVNEDTPTNGAVTATNPNGAPLTFSIVANGTKGTAMITNSATGAFTYAPNTNSNGTDTFTFKANNGQADSNVATITITITPNNDAPVASNGTASTSSSSIPVNGVLIATDGDNDTLLYSVVTNGTKGTATITNSTTGAYTYTPNAGASGTDTFTFKAWDGTVDSNTATITITILNNQPPVANNSAFTTPEDTRVSGSLSASDPDGNRLTYVIVTNGLKGTATIKNSSRGAFTYVPNPNANGSDSLTFRVSDGQTTSNEASVAVTINPVADAPVAINASYRMTIGGHFIGTLRATDGDGDALTFSVPPPGPDAHYSLRLNDPSTGAFRFTPDLGYMGKYSFTFTVTDPSGRSSSGTVTIIVQRVRV